MNIRVAKTAGFCFGVDRAVKICEELAAAGKKAVTLGPIIHNEQVVARLRAMGVHSVDAPEDVPEGTVAVIRSHGVAPSVYDVLAGRGIEVVDATCPFVETIHDIVKKGAEEGRAILIAGDKNHPEVVGIAGFCAGSCYSFDTLDELRQNIFDKTGDVPALMVAQTTFNLVQYKKCVESAKRFYSDLLVRETVCSATEARQLEAAGLGLDCDVCIVIGGKNSSNTKKLFDICDEHATTYLIETKDELRASMLQGATTIGVTAGASTPAPQIEEVLTRMSDMIKEEGMVTEEATEKKEVAAVADTEVEDVKKEEAAPEPADDYVSDEDFNFEEALEDSLRPIHRNQRVTGVVTEVRSNEVVVDIGSKHTGIIPAEEMSDDSSAKLEDQVKVGDELSLLVIKTNDQEGIATLSKKRVDSAEGLEILMQAAEEGEVLDGYVAELVNKGLIAVVKGVRVFVPASQATLRRGENYDNLLHQNVQLKILEVNPARRRAIGSIRAVAQETLNERRDAFWAEVEEGKQYTGTVKSLTSYGAFVDLGGVDGMVHISELSWQRIKNPADIVSVGEEVEVYVREVDRERQRISLGYRKEDDNPWKVLEKTYGVGDVFNAPVVSLTKFGAFVRVMPGIDGLVHISEISEEHVDKVSDLLEIGDEVMVKLIGVDYDRKRISLSMKFEGAPVLERKPAAEEPEEAAEAALEIVQQDAPSKEPEAEAAEPEAEEPEVPVVEQQQAIDAEDVAISPVDEAVEEFEEPSEEAVEKAGEMAADLAEKDEQEPDEEADKGK